MSDMSGNRWMPAKFYRAVHGAVPIEEWGYEWRGLVGQAAHENEVDAYPHWVRRDHYAIYGRYQDCVSSGR